MTFECAMTLALQKKCNYFKYIFFIEDYVTGHS